MYKEKIVELLKENMTERSYKLWEGIDKTLPNVWDRPTSSTGKWHKKLNGEVPTQAEHTYHMLFAASKIMRMFNIEKNTTDADKILMAIVLHDSLKYGNLGNRKHTDYYHDKNCADMIESNRSTFLKIFKEDQFDTLVETVRFHSGRWSTDAKFVKDFDFKNYSVYTMFVHMLDMMSTADLIQTDIRD
jgi:hypothetical protein